MFQAYSSILAIIGLICAVWVIYDVLANQRRMQTGMKVLWIFLAIFFSIITAIVYYLVQKK
jgi:prolipoprotein diacylglyceryltransferase